MVKRCVLGGCSNSNLDGISIHMFPRDNFYRKKWDDFVRLTRKDWDCSTNASVLCGAHFVAPDDFDGYQQWKMGFKKLHLKKGAVPSIIRGQAIAGPSTGTARRSREGPSVLRGRRKSDVNNSSDSESPQSANSKKWRHAGRKLTVSWLSKDSRTSTVSKASPLYPVAISSTQTTESAKYTDISSGNNKEECPKLQKTTRHPNETDGMRESFEEVTQKIMERFHGNISTVQDISIVINSLAEFCCISTEWMDMDEKASGSLDEYSDGIDKESAKTSPLEMHIEIPTEKIPADCGDSWKTCMEREGDLQHRQIRSNGKKCGHKQVRPFCQQRGGDKKLNKCNACGKKFSNQTNLKNHLLRHIAGKSQNPECGEMFQTGEVSSQHGLIKGVSDFSEAPSPSSDHPSQGRSTRWEVYVKKGKRFLTEYVNDLFQYTSHSGPVQDGPPALSVPKK
ncbi:zinc finger protein 37-like isoform X2 [Ptychodera flava]|uniref:zinc finger protein 37-like isoform X2 n=1 Tax=Ptychodera flava TaxID=63121 RepID=UPI00396A0EF8